MKRRSFLFALSGAPAAAAQETVFRANARLVEVHVTVRDHKGRYVEGLKREDLELTDGGEPQPIEVMEESRSGVSCAILLDTTGSMAQSLPVVKNAILRLIDTFRPQDAIAVYGFASSLNRLEDFTQDRAAVKRAVLQTRASGRTALFDALAVVSGSVSRREGMKAIVLFTDGNDNASFLAPQLAIQRAKRAGVPVYAVAQGEALKSERFMRQLGEIARNTGGQPYSVHKVEDVEGVFDKISEDLNHTYLIAYRPRAGGSAEWRPIKLAVKGHGDYRIRAREGYFAE